MKERKRKSREIELPDKIGVVCLEEEDNVIAYCVTSGCRSVLFNGSDNTSVGHRILRDSVIEHLGAFGADHNIELIYPRRRGDGRVTTSMALLENLAFLKMSGQFRPKGPPLQ